MNHYEPTDIESTDVEPRTERALTESMTVLEEGGDIYTVVGENQNGEYRVDAREGRCTCADHKYRRATCKHQRRVAFATGERPVPAGVAVDEHLGEHLEGDTQRAVATDGGRQQCARARSRVPVAGGVLVYEQRELGKELVGFEEVENWSDLRSALAARGHNVGAIHHKPVLDE